MNAQAKRDLISIPYKDGYRNYRAALATVLKITAALSSRLI